MYLPNIRSTIVALATLVPPALLSCCISNNYQTFLLQILEGNLKITKKKFSLQKIAFCARSFYANKKDKNCCFDSIEQQPDCQQYWQEITSIRSYLITRYFTFESKVQIFCEGHKFSKKSPILQAVLSHCYFNRSNL